MPYKLSPSRLSLLQECKRCFWLHFNRDVKRPQGPFPSLPNGMDRILKQHFDRFRENGGTPPELQGARVDLFSDKELLEKWRNHRKGIKWEDENGNVFKGAVDSILEKDDQLIVLDYKTRGYPPKDEVPYYYKNQLDIYNFLLRKNGYETKPYSFLLYFHPDKVNGYGNFIFHKDLKKVPVDIQNAKSIFEEALEVLNGDMPDPDPDCDFCRWSRNT